MSTRCFCGHFSAGVNVWIALVAEGHSHHLAARRWFQARANSSVAFCRITQMGVLRLLTNPHVMGRAPRSIAEAWEIFTRLHDDRRVVFEAEPDGVDAAWQHLTTSPGVGASSWTDAYLAAFAHLQSYELISLIGGWTAGQKYARQS